VARIGDMRNAFRVLMRKPETINNLENRGIEENIKLTQILKCIRRF
jgi:hypothetical protein